MKTCNMCGLSEPNASFGSVWNGNRCKKCVSIVKKAWRDANPERSLKIAANYRDRHPEKCREKSRKSHHALRLEVLTALGGMCECCGETAEPFLSLEHRNGTGALHRKILQRRVYADVKRQGFPLDKFGVLCMNCNVATKNGRQCPHVFDIKRLRLA